MMLCYYIKSETACNMYFFQKNIYKFFKLYLQNMILLLLL